MRHNLDVLADDAPQQLHRMGDHFVQVENFGLADLPAAERQQLRGQTRRLVRPRTRSPARNPRRFGAPSASIAIMSAYPWITVSRLLKSCATPPASRPTASSFCDCRNCSSSELLLRDVAVDRDRPADAALAVPQRRRPDHHVDFGAVFAAALALDAGKRLAFGEPLQPLAVLFQVLFADDGQRRAR